MKKALTGYVIFISIFFYSCKNESNDESNINKNKTAEEVDDFESIEAEQNKDLETGYFFVLAPNGLSLRTSDNLTSKRLLTIPYGEKVKQIATIHTIDFTVENIGGSMMEVLYKEQIGYAFSGFLSKFPVSDKEEESKAYAERLRAIDLKVSFETKRTEPDFHDGVIELLTLPSTQWHEAFYLAKAKYDIPKSFTFPGHKGSRKETISQIDKKEDVWTSELNIIRDDQKLQKITYSWRSEGSGYVVSISYPNKNYDAEIEYTAYAD